MDEDSSSSEFIPISEELIEFIKPELAPGEKLVWVSRADQACSTDSLGPVNWTWIVLLGMLLWGFGCYVISFVPIPVVYYFIGGPSPFLGITAWVIGEISGFFIILSLILSAWDRRLRSRRIYALTDQRAIFWDPVPRSDAFTVRVFPRGSIQPEQILRTEFPDGSGNLSLQGRAWGHGNFEGVADVRRVELLVRRFLIASDPGSTA